MPQSYFLKSTFDLLDLHEKQLTILPNMYDVMRSSAYLCRPESQELRVRHSEVDVLLKVAEGGLEVGHLESVVT